MIKLEIRQIYGYLVESLKEMVPVCIFLISLLVSFIVLIGWGVSPVIATVVSFSITIVMLFLLGIINQDSFKTFNAKIKPWYNLLKVG